MNPDLGSSQLGQFVVDKWNAPHWKDNSSNVLLR